jgi:hypothetical protein
MSLTLPRAAALAAACSWVLCSRVAAAAPCGRPDVDLTFPPNQAQNVPTNAVFAAHYAAPALYNDEPVDVTDAGGNAVPVTLVFDEADALLRATPDQPLVTGQLSVVWPALRGVGASSGTGRGSTTTVSIGGTEDAAPPTFTGLTGIDWDLARDRDPCLDKLEDRFVFKLKVGAATDDMGTDLLSLVVFETVDPTLPEQTQPTQVAVRALPDEGSVEVRRPATKAGQTCFAAVVQDLLGHVSGGGEREVCINPKKPPFFEGCTLAPSGAGAPGAPGGSASLLALLGLLFRRGRSARKHPTRAV